VTHYTIQYRLCKRYKKWEYFLNTSNNDFYHIIYVNEIPLQWRLFLFKKCKSNKHMHECTKWVTHTHTHTHTFNGPLSGTTWMIRYQKGKTNRILLKQETASGSGISWAICKCAPRSRQITTLAPHHSDFYRPDALPAAQPTASKHWRDKWVIQP